MNTKLGLFVCKNLAPEVSQILMSENFPDVELITYSSSCTGSPLDDERILKLTAKFENNFSKILFFVSSCRIKGNDQLLKSKNIQVIRLEQCLELMINRELIYHYVQNGYYLVSNGWLKNYKFHIKNWGFQGDTAKVFFKESVKKVLLLDTGIQGDVSAPLLALSEYMGLTYETLPIGLSYCKNFIQGEILRWRFESERVKMNENISKLTRDNADYLFIFKQLEYLAGITKEDEIIQEVFKLINTLYAPMQIAYFCKCSDTQQEIVWFNGESRPSFIIGPKDFEFEIQEDQICLGVFKIFDIQFPDYISQYKRMISVLSRICGITLSNARRYQVIQDQKEQLQKTTSLLNESLQTKDRFFSIIAHDLRSPFNAIQGFSNLMKESVENKNYEKVMEYAEIILQSSDRSMSLLSNLMEWSRSQTGRIDFNPLNRNLSKLVEDVILLFNGIAYQKSIQIQSEIPIDLKVYADYSMINTVLRNLISNAVKFTRPNGLITVKAIKNQNECVISVQDTGVGIEPSVMQKMFQIDGGHTTVGTNNEIGTGLGLILCKEFIEKHDGRIWVESEVGKGSVFYFSLKHNNTVYK